jgi:4a-hydroxytetrahydrobiopterin dehydratase
MKSVVLTESEIQARLAHVDGWTLEHGEIVRKVQAKDFAAALLFVNAVGLLAEAAGHHPDILITYNRVKLSLMTHDSNGITEKDFMLAEKINALPVIK